MKSDERHNAEQEAFSRALSIRLKELRVEYGYTQERLAYSCDVALYTVQRLERGKTAQGDPLDPRCFTLLKIAETYGLTLSELLEGV